MFGARARARSTDFVTPWPEAHALEPSLAYPVGAIAAIVYGSLLPFRFDLRALTGSNPLHTLTFHAASVEDVLVNVLLYVPLGLLLALCARRWFKSGAGAISYAVLVAFGVSVSVECLQTGVAERVASWLDVCLNTTGAALGALIAWASRVPVGTARRHRASRGTQGWTLLLVAGLLHFGLAPFDFVTNSHGLHEAFRRARWDITQPRVVDLTSVPLSAISHELAVAGWFALLGALAAFGRLSRRRGAGSAMASAIKQGVILAALIEMLQLFTRSQTCDVASIVLRAAATAFGAWSAVVVVYPLVQRHPRDPRRRAVALLGLSVIAGCQVAVLAARNLRPPVDVIGGLLGCRMETLPFDRLWRMSALSSATELACMGVTAAALAVVFSLLARQMGAKRGRSLSVLGTTGVLFLVEIVRAASGDGLVDLTGAIVAAFVAFAIPDLVEWFIARPIPPRDRVWAGERLDGADTPIGHTATTRFTL